ncbi:transposase family protein [Streptomyces sp. NPDC091416]
MGFCAATTSSPTCARGCHRRLDRLGFLGLSGDSGDPMIVTGSEATHARKLTPGEKEANRVMAATRAPFEHGFGYLKTWRILTNSAPNPLAPPTLCALS